MAVVGGAVKCWKDELNISVYWVSRSINWVALREKPENVLLLEEQWLSTALGPGVKGQASVDSPGFFCSRKSHYLLEITLLSSKTNSTCNGFRTKTFCRNLQTDAALVLLLESRGPVILSSYFRGDTDHVSTRVALIGFQFAVVALGEGNIFCEKLLRASKKNKMYFLPAVSYIFPPPIITQQVNGAEWSCRVGG